MTLDRTIRIVSLAIPIFFWAGTETPRAENPAGDYEIQLGGSDPIITIDEITIEEQQCEVVPDIGELCVEITTNIQPAVDARGKMSGVGSFSFEASGDGVELAGTMGCMVSGRVSRRMDSASRDHDTKVAIKLRCKGNVAVTDVGVFTTRITAKFKGEANDDGMYVGEVSARVSIQGVGSEKVVFPVFLEFGNGGDWTISLNIIDIDGKKLGGAAVATLDDGSTLSFEIRARYNEKKDESNVTLKPHKPFRGASIRLRHLMVASDAIVSGELKYRVNGQKGKVLEP
jgi:hypothetical protein